MKINDSRFFLITGLAISLELVGSTCVIGAPNVRSSRIAQAPDLSSTPMPLPPSGTSTAQPPSWKPTPLSPGQFNSSPVDPPSPPSASPVSPAPMSLGTQPNLSPADRPPLGMFYKEQERLDGRDQKPRPLPTVPYPGSVNPPAALPSVVDGVTIDGAPQMIDGSSIIGAQPVTDRFGYAPPPGTLGQTYKRRTRVIEDTKHPRVGAVEVNLPEGVDVTGTGLKSKWTGKVWRLDSEPLLPGIPHIYEIKASWGEGLEPQVRTVRLIMGRIVELDF